MSPESQVRKIFIADPSSSLIDRILQSEFASNYSWESAQTGPLSLKKIQTFKPDLALIDLMLPQVHGIEILKTLRKNPETCSMGIVISSYNEMIQNYHAAIECGANYFLTKPFDLSFFLELRHHPGNLTNR